MIRGSDLRLANVRKRLKRLQLFNLKAKAHTEIMDWDLQPKQKKGHTRMCRFSFILLQSPQKAAT